MYEINWLARMGRTGLMGRRYQKRLDEGNAGGPMIAGNRLGVPPLALEVRWEAGSGSYHLFHWCYKGRRIFLLVQKNNHNMLHTNPNS